MRFFDTSSEKKFHGKRSPNKDPLEKKSLAKKSPEKRSPTEPPKMRVIKKILQNRLLSLLDMLSYTTIAPFGTRIT